MAELKTRPAGGSVTAFIAAIDDPQKRKDARQVGAMMRLSDVDEVVLEDLIHKSVQLMCKRYQTG